MAWQQPKTNWTGSDGVRFSDLNRIEGNTAELLARINSGSGLTTNTTVYVSKSGSDTTGDGTASQPFATIGKAVSFIPKSLNGRSCTISIGAGTYSEVVALHDFHGGAVVLTGSGQIDITGLTVENCSVLLSSLTLVVRSNGIFVGPKGLLYAGSGSVTVNGATTAVTLRYGAVLEITTTLTINQATDAGIRAQYGSTASIANVLGANNNVAVHIYQSIVYVNNLSLSANVAVVNENGAFYQGGVTA